MDTLVTRVVEVYLKKFHTLNVDAASVCTHSCTLVYRGSVFYIIHGVTLVLS